MNKRFWVIILGLWVALLIFLVFLAGWYVAKNEFTQPHFATFSEATQRFEEGDAIVGSQTNMDAIVYFGYEPATKTVSFWDEATKKTIRVAPSKTDGNIVVFDPISNNLQDRGFSISNVQFIKDTSKTWANYIMEGSVRLSFYKTSYDNIPADIVKIRQDGYDEGYQNGLAKIIDYSKINNITLDGSGLSLPSNYGFSITSTDDGTVFTLTKDTTHIDIGSGIIPYTFRNWSFTGAPIK